VPARGSRSCSPSTAPTCSVRPHDACYSDRRRARVIAAARFGGCSLFPRRGFGTLPVLWDGKTPPGVLFPLRSGIAIIPSPRPAFVGGKGSPCEKKQGMPP
jgi:hypothetical protein